MCSLPIFVCAFFHLSLSLHCFRKIENTHQRFSDVEAEECERVCHCPTSAIRVNGNHRCCLVGCLRVLGLLTASVIKGLQLSTVNFVSLVPTVDTPLLNSFISVLCFISFQRNHLCVMTRNSQISMCYGKKKSKHKKCNLLNSWKMFH